MRSILCSLIAIVFYMSQLHSQSVTTRTGPVVDSEIHPKKFLVERDGKIFTLSGDKESIYLEAYAMDDLAFDFNKEIKLPEIEDKEQELEDVYSVSNGFIVLTSLRDKKTESYISKGYLLDNEGNMGEESFTLFEAEVAKKGERIGVKYYASKDKNYFAGVLVSTKRKDEQRTITIKLFDASLKEIYAWVKDVSLETNLKKIAFGQNGDVVALFSEKHTNKKEEITWYTHSLDLINTQGEIVKTADIDNSDTQLFGIAIDYQNENEVLITGMYASLIDNPWSSCSGHAFILFDTKSRSITTSKFEKYDIKFQQSLIPPKRMKKAGEFVILGNNFEPRRRILNSDGGVTVISEEHYLTSQRTTGAIVTTEYFGKLFVIRYSKSGEVIWSELIPKGQYSSSSSPTLGVGFGSMLFSANFFQIGKMDSDYYSFGLLRQNESITLTFYDNPINATVKPCYDSDPIKNAKNATAMAVTIDGQGSVSKSIFEVSGDPDLRVAFKYCFDLDASHDLVQSMKKDSRQFCVLGLE